jgi:hypothetical protein
MIPRSRQAEDGDDQDITFRALMRNVLRLMDAPSANLLSVLAS